MKPSVFRIELVGAILDSLHQFVTNVHDESDGVLLGYIENEFDEGTPIPFDDVRLAIAQWRLRHLKERR